MKPDKIASLGLVAMLGACVGTEIEVVSPFVPAQAAYVNHRGAASVRGQAFMRQLGGGVVTCAGEKVRLIPATAYTRERITKLYGNPQGGRINVYQGTSGKNLPPAYFKYMRQSICDAEGNFEFNGVADGTYYLVTRIVWMVPGSYLAEGGGVAKRVTVKGGRSVRVILS
jgi:hypothetical protein